jgi:superfamily II DNA helicase RecQ
MIMEFGMLWCDKSQQNRHNSACIKCSAKGRANCGSYQEWKNTMLFCSKRSDQRVHEDACITCGEKTECKEYINHNKEKESTMGSKKERTMKDMVAEYNELTGEDVKKFKSKDEAKKAIAKAKKPKTEKKAGKEPAMKVSVGKNLYKSVTAAFTGEEVPFNAKFRKELNSEGTMTFKKEDGTKLVFKILD